MGKALDFDSSIVGSNPATSIRDRLEQAGVILMVPCRDDAKLNSYFKPPKFSVTIMKEYSGSFLRLKRRKYYEKVFG